MYVVTGGNQASINTCPHISSALSICIYVLACMYMSTNPSIGMYIPADFSRVYIHFRKCIYVQICILRHRQVMHTYPCTHAHV